MTNFGLILAILIYFLCKLLYNYINIVIIAKTLGSVANKGKEKIMETLEKGGKEIEKNKHS